jgi:hypothetical protein
MISGDYKSQKISKKSKIIKKKDTTFGIAQGGIRQLSQVRLT